MYTIRILMLLIIMAFGKISVSQPYQRMLGQSNEWYHLTHTPGGIYTELWKTTTDTLIRSNLYKKIEGLISIDQGGMLFDDCLLGFIREDTFLKRVYYLNCRGCNGANLNCDTSELFIYDFGKSVGDTIMVNHADGLPSFFQSLIIDTIIVDTTLSPNRLYFLRSSGGYIAWIEGVGSLKGLRLNTGQWNYDSSPTTMRCAFRDSIQTFHFYETGYSPTLDTCLLNILFTGIREETTLSIKLFPNPTMGSFHIESTDLQSLQSISIEDLSGRLLFQTSIIQTEVPVSNFAKGLYLMRVQFTNGESIVKKIMVN